MVDFALGTARLSRLSQRPIVVCVPFLDEAGRTVLEWSLPIPAPARDDDGADARITNDILDILERAIGLRPGQYVLAIGEQRRWSETAKCWVDLAERPILQSGSLRQAMNSNAAAVETAPGDAMAPTSIDGRSASVNAPAQPPPSWSNEQ
jgi:hypothetical protein